MRTLLLPLAALATAAALPALAGGLAPVPPEPAIIAPAAPQYDWTGFSAGVQLGYGDVSTSGAADLSGDDMLYGVRAYYDYDFGRFVVGGGLQYDKTDIDLEGAASIDSVLRLGARAGFDSNRNFYYATAGYARAETDDGALSVGASDGYFAGLGYEVFLTQSVTAGAEVLYHKFKDFDVDNLDAEATTAALSINFRF